MGLMVAVLVGVGVVSVFFLVATARSRWSKIGLGGARSWSLDKPLETSWAS